MEDVTRDEYTRAMRKIIMYDSLTDRQIKAMPSHQINKWDIEFETADKIRKQFIKQQKLCSKKN